MDKFWKFYHTKTGYVLIKVTEDGFLLRDNDYHSMISTKQMLIGYMIEYLSNNNIVISLGAIHTVGGKQAMETIQSYYERLEKQIKEVS